MIDKKDLQKRIADILNRKYVPSYEQKRLKSLLNPISIEEAEQLADELGGVSNYMFVLNSEEDLEKVRKYDKKNSLDEEDREKAKKGDFYVGLGSTGGFYIMSLETMISKNIIGIKI